MTEPRANLEELKAAEAAATSAPWFAMTPLPPSISDHGYRNLATLMWHRKEWRVLFRKEHQGSFDVEANATLIALMRNALPALIAEVEALREWKVMSVSTLEMFEREEERMQAEIERLREALESVRNVHRPLVEAPVGPEWCYACDTSHPCITRQITNEALAADATHEQVIGGAP